MKKNTLFFIFFCCSFLTVAQVQYKFARFTTDDGLPTNSIYAISENKNGTIILGTDNGLTFFDGNNFKTFNVKDGLKNPFIVAVYTDKDNVVWFINYAGKLQKFANNKIVTTPVFTNHANSIITTKNEVFLYTSQNRYANNTYLYLKINKNNWIIKEPQKYASEINKIAPPILVQNEQQIRFENNYLLFKNLKVAVPKEVSLLHKVIFRKADVLLIDENYLFVLDYHKKEFSKISLPCALSKNHIYKFDFVTDKQNNCWLNIQNKGLFILQNNKWVAVNKNLGLNATDNINFLFCDSTGKMWIATNEKGLFCIASTAISYYQFANENNYFNGFATAIDGKSLFISSKFCLYMYKNNDLRFLKKSDSEIKIDNYHNIPVFFTPAKKVTQWDPKLNMLLASGKQLLKYNTGTSITLNGANAINYNQTQVVSHQNEKIKNVVIHKNKYYFNNSDKISVRIFNEKEFTIQRELKLNIKGYIQDFIFIKDTLWIATEGKVYKAFNEKIVDSISTINNFVVENVNKIKVYNDVVFLCSSKGLFAVKNKCNRVLNQFNYLPGNEVYNAIIFNNELLVATKDGLAKIKTILAFTATQKPKLQLVYNNSVTAQINMGARQEAVKIELQIQNFYSVKNQIIQYKIDNLKWINTENKALNFQSLAYGKHVVLVRVKDVNSMWAAKKIVVYKAYPFYLKWWFIALAAVLFLVIIILIYKNKVNKINVKKQLEIGTNNRLIELRQSALSAMM
ncbi:MAG: hypothetical protein H7221_03020, partial [Flavobacterium sp.]|nr:hypothetical protein [Flavobacterium sp.]